MPVDRRRFLQLAASAIVATVADSACATGETRTTAGLTHPELLSMLGAERVRELGTHYRTATQSENTTEALRVAISKGAGSHIPLIRSESLDDQIRADFENGRTVLVDGWVLSVTEARQAALFSLTPA